MGCPIFLPPTNSHLLLAPGESGKPSHMDKIRRAVRGILGPNSRLYRSGARALDFFSVVVSDGFSTWRTLREIEQSFPSELTPRTVPLRKLKFPIRLRPGTDDVGTVINNVIREEYGAATPLTPPRWMIDAGAYIGDTSAYFLSRYPDLKIIALEPNLPSYEMARLNLLPYRERAILLQKGLYSTDGVASFSGGGTGAAIASTGDEIHCTTVPSLLAEYEIEHLDILKMDIEGAEEAIFSAKPETWLGRVGMLIIEIHGPRPLSLISRVLAQNGFAMRQYRSIWFCKAGIERRAR
jgi:FkbM family methyltransferase